MKRRAVEGLARTLGFPPGLWSRGGDGLRADCEGGLLTLLAWWESGAPVGARLELQPRQRAGVLRTPRGSGGTEDREVYARGKWERFDAWSDNQRPERISWSRWTQRAAAGVLGRPGCLLCGQPLSREPAKVHLAEGRGHLCGACWGRARAEAPTPRQWPLGDRGCGACGCAFGDAELLHEGARGKVCPGCVASASPLSWRRRVGL